MSRSALRQLANGMKGSMSKTESTYAFSHGFVMEEGVSFVRECTINIRYWGTLWDWTLHSIRRSDRLRSEWERNVSRYGMGLADSKGLSVLAQKTDHRFTDQ